MVTFVIPVKYNPEEPVVFDCVNSIKVHHPDAKIILVDSASEDRSYLLDLNPLIDVAADIENTGYPIAAYKWAVENYDSDQWGFIHDSIVLNSPLPEFDSVLSVRHFENPPDGWGWDAQGVSLDVWAKTNVDTFPIPDTFAGVLGPMWFCTDEVVKGLTSLGLFDIEVSDKYQLCAMERVVGIALSHLGYNPRNSLQGQMRGFFDAYDETVVKKCHPGRL